MTLADLSHLAREPRDADAWSEYRPLIERAIDSSERSLQTRIGPSELGNPCDRCLIHKLAGTPEHPSVAWLPFIGTATHAALADIFMHANAELERVRFLVEATVSVGTVGGVDITGHLDLFDIDLGELTDWKVVGKTTLDKVRRTLHPGEAYRTQQHCYGLGLKRRGLRVRKVRVAFLPRNELSLRGAHIWEEPYDESVALRAIARADMFATAIAVLGVDNVLASAPPHLGSEFSCNRYPDTQALARAGQSLTSITL